MKLRISVPALAATALVSLVLLDCESNGGGGSGGAAGGATSSTATTAASAASASSAAGGSSASNASSSSGMGGSSASTGAGASSSSSSASSSVGGSSSSVTSSSTSGVGGSSSSTSGGTMCPAPDGEVCGSCPDPTQGAGGAPACNCNLPNAIPQCVGNGCAIYQCIVGFQDCNGTASDGCEKDLRHDIANCGSCGHACAGGEMCDDGICTVSCVSPLTNCLQAGCADLQNSPDNCGVCGKVCPTTWTRWACVAGQCQAPAACPPPGGDPLCNCVPGQDPACACKDTLADLQNCGSCGHFCPFIANLDVPLACVGGACVGCPAGTTFCSVQHFCEDLDHDSKACGLCDNDCAGGACVAGQCQPFGSVYEAVYGGGVTDFVLDGSDVYLVDSSTSTVSTVAKTGGAVTLLAAVQPGVANINVDATNLYWSTGNLIVTMAKSGGAVTPLTMGVSVASMISDATNLYWMGTDKALYTAPKAGGLPSMLAAKTNGYLAQNSAQLFYSYYDINLKNGFLYAVDKASGVTSMIFAGVDDPAEKPLLADDTNLYYVDKLFPGVQIELRSIPVLGGPAQRWWGGNNLSKENPNQLLALDGPAIYFGTFFGSEVRRVDCPNAQWAAIVANAGTKIAVDSKYVYYEIGGLYRKPK